MAETVFVRGTGGAIFEMDVPESGHARERFDQAIEKGDLLVLPHAEWETRPDGSRHLVVPTEPDAPAQAEPVEKWKKDDLAAWLTDHGQTPDPKATKADLVFAVESTIWNEAVAEADAAGLAGS